MFPFLNVLQRGFNILLLTILALIVNHSTHAQSLVANGDFEGYNSCPTAFSCIDPWPSFTYVKSWARPTDASPDYFNACSNDIVGVPINTFGYQPAHSGNGYAGFYAYTGGTDYREYICTKLSHPMQKDSLYCVSFFLSLASLPPAVFTGFDVVAVNEVGVNFSNTLTYSNTIIPLALAYHVVSDSSVHMTDTGRWYEVRGFYKAQGGEEWMTIGTFGLRQPKFTYLTAPTGKIPICYYYIDDVTVGPLTHVDNPHTVVYCGKPMILTSTKSSGPYMWSNGDTSKSIVIDKTGEYQCHVFQGCNLYSDYFTIQDMPVVETLVPVRVCDTSKVDTVLKTIRSSGPVRWNTDDTTRTLHITKYGDYYCDSTGNCTVYRERFQLKESHVAAPVVPDTMFCLNTLSPHINVNDNGLLWYTASAGGVEMSAQPQINTSQKGQTTLYVAKYQDGCVSKRVPVSVEIRGLLEAHTTSHFTHCAGAVLDKMSLGADLGPDVDYSWNSGDTVCCKLVSEDGVFIRTSDNGCGAVQDIFVIEAHSCENCMFFPNIFSPNYDGRNDQFRAILRCPVKDFQLRICNRWGQTVYYSEQPEGSWDGTTNGRPAPEGVYMYFVSFGSYSEEGILTTKGDVTLIR
jgi:gliding motility-associated-like protein